MPRVGFKPTVPASKRAKTVHALDHSDTVPGQSRECKPRNEVPLWIGRRLVRFLCLSYRISKLHGHLVHRFPSCQTSPPPLPICKTTTQTGVFSWCFFVYIFGSNLPHSLTSTLWCHQQIHQRTKLRSIRQEPYL
jgi:hypothetical protein